MTPVGLRPFEPPMSLAQCFEPAFVCPVCDRVANGGQATTVTMVSVTALYPEPANDSINNESRLKVSLRQVQAYHILSLFPHSRPIAGAQACLPYLAHPRQPALTGLPSLATSCSPNLQGCLPPPFGRASGFAQQQKDLHAACSAHAGSRSMTASLRQHDTQPFLRCGLWREGGQLGDLW
jgi:hypothetical protein